MIKLLRMAGLARLGHQVRFRLPSEAVRCSIGGLSTTRIICCNSVKCLATSKHHSLYPDGNFRKIQPTTNVDSRALKTQASDNIDEESGLPLIHPTRGILVYSGKMSSYVKGLKTLSLSTSLLALLAQPMVLSAAKDDMLFKAGLIGSFSVVLFSTPVLVHFVTKKYVTDIYFNEDNKMFTLAYKSFFLRRKELQYKAGDVEIPFAPRMFVTHIIKGKSFFIELDEFRGKEIYKHMVGFDKPIDLGLGNQNKQSKPKKKKKFGLFEDEDEKEKEVADKKKSPEFISKQLMYDDDDDDDASHVGKQKQANKMH